MSNDIKLLKDYIEALRNPKSFKYTNEQKAQAIENLIKENKELKEKAKQAEHNYDELTKITGRLKTELEEEKEKNKLTANDIENFKCQAYMLGRADENEAMKGVLQRHYISKNKIRKDLETCQKVYEKEQLVNKRNCLKTQMKTYEMLLKE